jgi:hypothetical protein
MLSHAIRHLQGLAGYGDGWTRPNEDDEGDEEGNSECGIRSPIQGFPPDPWLLALHVPNLRRNHDSFLYSGMDVGLHAG